MGRLVHFMHRGIRSTVAASIRSRSSGGVGVGRSAAILRRGQTGTLSAGWPAHSVTSGITFSALSGGSSATLSAVSRVNQRGGCCVRQLTTAWTARPHNHYQKHQQCIATGTASGHHRQNLNTSSDSDGGGAGAGAGGGSFRVVKVQDVVVSVRPPVAVENVPVGYSYLGQHQHLYSTSTTTTGSRSGSGSAGERDALDKLRWMLQKEKLGQASPNRAHKHADNISFSNVLEY